MDRYNFKEVEEKWQNKWINEDFFHAKIDKDKKILLLRNVFIPIRKNTYGSCKELYNR